MYVCAQLPSCFLKERNKVSIASAYCSVVTVDNDRKRWWLTRWKTKVTVIVSNFFMGFISDSIVSMPCTLVFENTRHQTSPFLEKAHSSSKMKLHTSSMCSRAGTHVHTLTLLQEASE